MNLRYRVDLIHASAISWKHLLYAGKQAARKLKRAEILLAADVGATDEEIAATVGVGGSTLYRTKRRFVEGNLERTLSEEPRPGAERKLTGKEEALLVAAASSNPPAGRARLMLSLLADQMVKLTGHEGLSRETVRRRLIENHLKPWRRKVWCIPQVDAEYVAHMEDVLDLYAEQPDPQRPVVCFDESPIQLIGEVRQPLPPEPARIERHDYEYRRNGTANVFVLLDANRTIPDARPRSPSAVRRGTSPFACRTSPTSNIPGPSASRSCSTIYRPFGRRAVLGLPGRQGSKIPEPARVPLRPQTCQLPQHGRDRDRRARRLMPRPAHRKLSAPGRRGRRLAEAAQCRPSPRHMELHNRTSPRKNRAAVIRGPPA